MNIMNMEEKPSDAVKKFAEKLAMINNRKSELQQSHINVVSIDKRREQEPAQIKSELERTREELNAELLKLQQDLAQMAHMIETTNYRLLGLRQEIDNQGDDYHRKLAGELSKLELSPENKVKIQEYFKAFVNTFSSARVIFQVIDAGMVQLDSNESNATLVSMIATILPFIENLLSLRIPLEELLQSKELKKCGRSFLRLSSDSYEFVDLIYKAAYDIVLNPQKQQSICNIVRQDALAASRDSREKIGKYCTTIGRPDFMFLYSDLYQDSTRMLGHIEANTLIRMWIEGEIMPFDIGTSFFQKAVDMKIKKDPATSVEGSEGRTILRSMNRTVAKESNVKGWSDQESEKYLHSQATDFETIQQIALYKMEGKTPFCCVEISNKDYVTINHLAFSPDGKYFAFVSDTKSILMINAETKEQIHHFENIHLQPISSLTISPDSKLLIAGCEDSSIRVFDTQSKQLLFSFNSISEELNDSSQNKTSSKTPEPKLLSSMVMTSDRKWILSGCTDGSIYISEFDKKAPINETLKTEHKDGIARMSVTKDGKYLATVSLKGYIDVFDIEKREKVQSFTKGSDDEESTALTTSTDNNIIFTATKTGKDFKVSYCIDIWNITEGGSTRIETTHKNIITSLVITPDGKYLISGSKDGSMKAFELNENKELHHFLNAHNKDITSIAISPSGREIISGDSEKCLKVWSLPTNSVVEKPNDVEYFFLAGINIKNIPNTKTFAEKQNYLSTLLPYRYLPSNWNILHMTAILASAKLEVLPAYEEMRCNYFVDVYGKTPLHYLLAPEKKSNPVAINSMFEYILAFLEDHSTKQTPEFFKTMTSLSTILPSIIKKAKPSLVTAFFRIAYSKALPSNVKELSYFGYLPESKRSSIVTSNFPLLDEEVKKKIFKEGDSMLVYRSVLVDLPNRNSQELVDVVSSLADSNNEDLFKTKTVATIIDHLWTITQPFNVMLALFYSALMIALSVYIGLGERLIPLEIVILVFAAVFLIMELLQMRFLGKKYFRSEWNVLDLIYFSFLIGVMGARLADVDAELTRSWLYTVVILAGYGRWISYLRILPSTRTLIRAILVILADIKGFLIVITMIILGFSLIFYEFGRERGYPNSLFDTYNLLYGNYNSEDLELSVALILAFILFLVSIVLLNLLIAIMGDSYDKVQDRRVLTDSKEKLEMIHEALIFRKFIYRARQEREGYMMFCEAVEDDGSDELATSSEDWDGKINALKKLIRQNEKDITKNIEKCVAQRTENLEKSILLKLNALAKQNKSPKNKKVLHPDAIQLEPQKPIHKGVNCNGCRSSSIEGVRYKCSVCHDFNYCENCEETKDHPHIFMKIKAP